MGVPSAYWRNLALAGAAAAAAPFALYDLYLWLLSYLTDPFRNDFSFYYAAARLGLDHGWSRLYDLSLQQQELDALGSGIHVAQLARFISPPPLAWLAVPFALMPYQAGYLAWSLLEVLCLGLTWFLLAPGRGWPRAIWLLVALGFLPVAYGLQLGQPPLLVVAAVAGAWALLRAGREVPAGALLAVAAVKPQLGLLVPFALLLLGHRRAFAAWAVTAALLAAAALASLGPDGTATYLDRLRFAGGLATNQELTLAYFLPLPVARVLEGLVALAALAAVWRSRSLELGISAALAGGLLASPYLHLDDLTLLVPAAWLFLRAQPARWIWAVLAAAAAAVESLALLGPLAALAGETAVFAVILVAAAGRVGFAACRTA